MRVKFEKRFLGHQIFQRTNFCIDQLYATALTSTFSVLAEYSPLGL